MFNDKERTSVYDAETVLSRSILRCQVTGCSHLQLHWTLVIGCEYTRYSTCAYSIVIIQSKVRTCSTTLMGGNLDKSEDDMA